MQVYKIKPQTVKISTHQTEQLALHPTIKPTQNTAQLHLKIVAYECTGYQ